MQYLMKPLRTCPICGLHAHTEEDLELFKKSEACLYGRGNYCKKCHREHVKEKDYRTKEFIEIFRGRSNNGIIRCYFCDEEVTKLKGLDGDSLHIHSLDEDHENWNPPNKVPTHNVCHARYHKTGEKNPNWKGDEASDSAKRKRVRRG